MLLIRSEKRGTDEVEEDRQTIDKVSVTVMERPHAVGFSPSELCAFRVIQTSDHFLGSNVLNILVEVASLVIGAECGLSLESKMNTATRLSPRQ